MIEAMEKKPQQSESRDADKYVVRFPDGMRDKIAAEAKSNNRSMNAEIVDRLKETFAPPDIRKVEERRKLELVAEYSSWCRRHDLPPENSFVAFSRAYSEAANSPNPSEISLVSSIDSVDPWYITRLYGTWIMERPERFPELTDTPQRSAQKHNGAVTALAYRIAQLEVELQSKQLDVAELANSLASAMHELQNFTTVEELDSIPYVTSWKDLVKKHNLSVSELQELGRRSDERFAALAEAAQQLHRSAQLDPQKKD